MNRRETVFALVALGGTPFTIQAQQQTKVARIAYLGFGNPEAAGHLVDALRQKMRDLGYVEGKSVVFDIRWALGKPDRLPDLAKELVALSPQVIVVLNGGAARAMQKATTTIPIVIGTISDPVGYGLVKSLARPGGNITGTSTLAADFGPKLLELLHSVVPQLSRVAVLFGPDSTIETLTQLQNTAQQWGVSVDVVKVQTPLQIENAFTRLNEEKIRGVIGWPSALLYAQRHQIAALATKLRMPSIFPAGEYPEVGILMSYGSSYTTAARDAAIYVDKILKGANPRDLPIQQPTVFELVVNLKTAKTLGIAIPKELLVRADRVIE